MGLKDEAITKARPTALRATPSPAAKPRPPAPLWRRAMVWTRRRRGLALGAAIAIIAILAFVFTPRLFKNPLADYVTAPVGRGSIEDTVTALGNLQPLNYVDVGAQVSGQIQAIHVAIGDEVKKGDLLVEIDPKVQQARVDESRSQLVSAEAMLVERRAGLKLKHAAAARETRLHAEGADSQAEYETALAELATAQAQVKSQQAQIAQAESTLNADVTLLGYSKIVAPMDGTIVSLVVKMGQTINATQQAPPILRIADLSTMTAWTQVSEADVARLKIGMPAYFTTLGDSTTRHSGKLRQILPTPDITNNVVLYNALFDVANRDQTLKTQMTAQVFFIVASAENVLTIPVAALQMGRIAGGERSARAGGRSDGAIGGASEAQRQAWRQAHQQGAGRRQFVSVVTPAGKLERRGVEVGITNRINAEIKSGLKEGETVIVGRKQAQARAASATQRSPLQQGPGGLNPRGGR
jgi:macrolide-specific efflux system membrane fusion protein